MSYNKIQFYDKQGFNQMPLLNDNGVFEFSMALERTSANLYSTQHVFMLEEVLFETEGEFVQKQKQQFVPVLIQILHYLRDWGSQVQLSDLYHFFDYVTNDDTYISNFLNTNIKYIQQISYGSYSYYTITRDGLIYVNSYDSDVELLNASNYRLDKTFTRPRTECNVDLGEDVYLTFNWTSQDNDENIFMFFIDPTDTTLYKGESSFSDPKTIPAIVRAYQTDLSAAPTNPYWKVWSEPYRFDFATHSANRTMSTDLFFNNDPTSYRILNTNNPPNQNPFQINIGFTSNTEGFYERTLEINITHEYIDAEGITQYLVTGLAKINFFGEIENEDERFKLLLENFGKEIRESDTFIFRDSDVYESLPNYIELNNKRKELLLVGDEIYPYIGSYKGFINALKFFGYYDLRLKEYFLNILMSDPKKGKIYYSAVEIPFSLESTTDTINYNNIVFGSYANSSFLKKTSRFGLYYDLNVWTGDYDDFGFPVMTDSFQFTNEEILIKLYGLKTILEERFLSHNVRIIDITGEGLYFAKFKINCWQDLTKIISLNLNNTPDFEATPTKGIVKSLQNLLNIFKSFLDPALFTLNSLNKDTILSDIVDRTLKEFLNDNDTTFPFDNGVGLSEIQSFYSDYFILKSVIFDNLTNSPCLDYINLSDINSINHNILTSSQRLTIQQELTKALSYSIKLYGLPVILTLKPFDITWNDLTMPWNSLGINPDIINYIPTGLDVDYIYSWDSLGYLNSQNINWFITHENNQYCKRIQGSIKDKKKILIFLPLAGFYDVSCTVQDSTNFPNMVGKKKYIEVIYPESNFIAFGSFVNNINSWNDMTDSWSNNIGSWISPSYCPIQTTWNDWCLTWDDLYYQNYTDQTLVKDINYGKILNYNESSFQITLEGSKFYFDNLNYANQKWNNTIVCERKTELVPTKTNIDIDSFGNNIINLQGNWNIPIGEKINCYSRFQTNNFILSGNTITIAANHVDAFRVGKFITIRDIVTDELFLYEILKCNVDLVNNFIQIELKDDGSLNEIVFNNIEYTCYNFIFKVLNSEYNSILNITKISVTNNDNIKLMKKILSNEQAITFKAEWGIYSGYFTFKVNNVILNEDNNSILELMPNTSFCLLTSEFNVQWCEYDIDYARRNSNVKTTNWNDLNLSWNNLNNLTWDMFEYHDSIITGFKISKITPNGWIMIDNEKFEWDFRIIDYYLVDNEYIQATIKNNNIDKLYQIRSNTGSISSLDTYPRDNFASWESKFYHGPNRPATWNQVKREWLNVNEKFENNNHDLSLTYDFDSVLQSTFNWSNLFISSKNMTIPVGVTLFIIHDNSNPLIQLDNKIIEWELFEETRQKLLIKTKHNFLIWKFDQSGFYSVKMKIYDKQNNIKEYKKQSWINVQ